MSQRKFASITGSLLARKGEAGASPASPRADLGGWPDTPAAHETAVPHRLTFRLDAERHRRLSIAAAQLQVPLQQLLATALDRYLATLAETELSGCACLRKSAPCCRSGEADGSHEFGRPA